MRTYFYFLILLAQVPLYVCSQPQHIKFRHLQTDAGLSQSNVLCILQDSRGFMWFGTRDGLNKYDSYKFTVYKKDVKNKYSISNNNVTDFIESANDDLWITTWGGGLNKFDRNKDEFIAYKNDPKNNNSISGDFLNALKEDSDGNLWIGTEKGGLEMFDRKNNKFIHYRHKENDATSISSDFVKTIFEDNEHNLWIGTAGGLDMLNKKDKTFTHFEHDDKNVNSLGYN